MNQTFVGALNREFVLNDGTHWFKVERKSRNGRFFKCLDTRCKARLHIINGEAGIDENTVWNESHIPITWYGDHTCSGEIHSNFVDHTVINSCYSRVPLCYDCAFDPDMVHGYPPQVMDLTKEISMMMIFDPAREADHNVTSYCSISC